MGRTNWTFEQLKLQLSSSSEVKGWTVFEDHTHRRERYFMSTGGKLITDQDRNVKSRSLSLRVFVSLPGSERQGETTKKLFPSLPLKDQIDLAIHEALQSSHPVWELPQEIPSSIPDIKTTDPRMAEDLDGVMEHITQKIENTIKETNLARTSTFNSAELFLSVHNRELHLSNGLNYRSSQSRIYTEAAFSYSRIGNHKQVLSDEYLNTHWSINLDDLPLEKLFKEAAFRAQNSLEISKPLTGKYPVIIDAEVLSTLLNEQIIQLSASNLYQGLPFIKPGEEFIPNAEGDLLSMTLDPLLEYGAATLVVSEEGLLQKPLKLVNKNRVIATSSDKKHADYLGTCATTSRGNMILEAGHMSYEELTQQGPQVIEILQFSGLFVDPNSGTFSSEIRLARLFDNQQGKVTYLKGGSLSGSISENFRNIKLSRNSIRRSHFTSESLLGQGYFGPDFALLSEVSIVG